MQLRFHDVLNAILAATPPAPKVPAGEPQAPGNWQVWLILVALSALTGLAVKLVSDRSRND